MTFYRFGVLLSLFLFVDLEQLDDQQQSCTVTDKQNNLAYQQLCSQRSTYESPRGTPPPSPLTQVSAAVSSSLSQGQAESAAASLPVTTPFAPEQAAENTGQAECSSLQSVLHSQPGSPSHMATSTEDHCKAQLPLNPPVQALQQIDENTGIPDTEAECCTAGLPKQIQPIPAQAAEVCPLPVVSDATILEQQPPTQIPHLLDGSHPGLIQHSFRGQIIPASAVPDPLIVAAPQLSSPPHASVAASQPPIMPTQAQSVPCSGLAVGAPQPPCAVESDGEGPPRVDFADNTIKSLDEKLRNLLYQEYVPTSSASAATPDNFVPLDQGDGEFNLAPLPMLVLDLKEPGSKVSSAGMDINAAEDQSTPSATSEVPFSPALASLLVYAPFACKLCNSRYVWRMFFLKKL